ncbi:MAG: cache domain-containing protein [Chloroflexota bacterium]
MSELTRVARQLWSSVGLGMKMAAIVVIGVIALVSLFAYLGTAALNENIQRTLQERVVLAQTTARHIDYLLTGIEDVLTDAAAQPSWQDPRAGDENLARAFQRLDFYATRVFLLDRSGRMVSAYPPLTSTVAFDQFASVQAVLNGQRFAVSRYLRSLGGDNASTVAAAPVRDANGAVIGALVTSINLISPNTRTFTNPIGLGATGYMDLIDRGGTILASTQTGRVGAQSDHGDALAALVRAQRQTVSACHDCHNAPAPVAPQRQVLAFAPLERAQWGVTVRQSEDEVFASIHQLQLRIFALMIVMLGGALILVYLTTRSVITPVQALTAATQRITTGDLDTPLGMHGTDEIGTLARSFDAMRVRLKESIAEIQMWNRNLDARVQERTAEIRQLYEELQQKEQVHRELLNRVFSAQEEERKRISRDLHDETCQVLTGLAYALDDTAEALPSSDLKPNLERMHELVNTALEEIHRIILDLRPTMLDHLGLVPALRWYAETRFDGLGIRFALREQGEPRRLPSPIETALFRVSQEAINNIARHSRATRADFTLEFAPDQIQVWIQDNGKGFDPAAVLSATDHQRGLGLLGMEERMSAVGGRVTIHSTPGDGTTIQLTVPAQET